MVVKPSYKRSDVGVIPEDWDIVSLGVLLRQGPTNGWSGRSTNDNTGTPTLSLAATTSGRLVLNGETVKHLARPIPSGSDLYLAPGDILVQRSNTVELVGTTAVFDGPPGVFVYPDLMMRLRFKLPVTGQWFWRYANSASGRSYFRSVAAGSTGSMPKISGANLREMPVPLPERAEQEAIAGALSDADALIESLEQLLTKKRQLKQGAMQELLTGKRRLPGFCGAWQPRSLRNALAIPVSDGPHLTPTFLNDGVPFLSVNNLVGNRIDLASLRFISREDHIEYSKKCRPQKGDVLLGKAASVGLVAIVDFDMEFNIWSPIALIRVNNDNVARYVYYCFQTEAVIRQIDLLTNSSSQGNIGMGDIERLVLLLPDKEEQQAIADTLSDVDADLAALEAKVVKARQIKQGMMQELLTGRIRLI
jgi:type I restriction enzyme S subunit